MTTLTELVEDLKYYALEPHSTTEYSSELDLTLESIAATLSSSEASFDPSVLDDLAGCIRSCVCTCRQQQTALLRKTFPLLSNVVKVWPTDQHEVLISELSKGLKSSSSAQTAIAILRLCTGLSACTSSDKLAELVAKALNRTHTRLAGNESRRVYRLHKKTFGYVQKMCSSTNGLTEKVLKFAASKELSGVFEFILQQTGFESDEIKSVAVDSFMQVAFASKKAPTDVALQGYSSTVQLLTAEDLAKDVLPKVDRALKLNSETKINSALFLVSNIKVDLSEIIQETSLVVTALKCLTSAKQHVAEPAAKLLAKITYSCKESPIFAFVLEQVIQVLQGAGPLGKAAVSQPTQRVNVISALSQLADVAYHCELVGPTTSKDALRVVKVESPVLPPGSSLALAQSCFDALAQLAGTERNEECKRTALATASQWAFVGEGERSVSIGKILGVCSKGFSKAASASTAAKVSGEALTVVKTLDWLCRERESSRRQEVARWLADPKQKDVLEGLAKVSLCIPAASANLFAASAPSSEAVQQSLSAYFVLLVCSFQEPAIAEVPSVSDVLEFFRKPKRQPAHGHILAAVSAAAATAGAPREQGGAWRAAVAGSNAGESVSLTAAAAGAELAVGLESQKFASKVRFSAALVACALVSHSPAVQRSVAATLHTAAQEAPEPALLCTAVSEGVSDCLDLLGEVANRALHHRFTTLPVETETVADLVVPVPGCSALRFALHAVAKELAAWGLSAAGVLALSAAAMNPLANQGTALSAVLARDEVLYKRTGRASYEDLQRLHPRRFTVCGQSLWLSVSRTLLAAEDQRESQAHVRHALFKAVTSDPAGTKAVQALVGEGQSAEDGAGSAALSPASRVARQRARAWLMMGTPTVLGSTSKVASGALGEWIAVLVAAKKNEPSADDLKVWSTPEDQVCELETKAEVVPGKPPAPKAPAAKLKQGRKGRGGTRKELYSVEGDEWELEVRKELAAKKKGTGKTSSAPKVDNKVLAKQQALRERLDKQFATVSHVLQTIQVVLKLSAHFHPRHDVVSFRELIELAFQGLLPLLSSPMYRSEASLALQSLLEYDHSLSRAVAGPGAAFELVGALVLAHSVDMSGPKTSKLSRASSVLCGHVDLLARVAATLVRAVGGDRAAFDPLDPASAQELFPSSMALLLPLLRLGLLGACSPQFKELLLLRAPEEAEEDEDAEDQAPPAVDPAAVLEDSAFALLALHAPVVGASNSFPNADARAAALETLLVVAEQEQLGGVGGGSVPWTRPGTQAVVLALCRAPSPVALSEAESALLLGDLGLLSPLSAVRECSLAALLAWHVHTPLEPTRSLVSRLWFACNDAEDAVSELADDLLDATEVNFPRDYIGPLVEMLGHPSAAVRGQVGKSLAVGVDEFPETAEELVKTLQDSFKRSTSREAEIERQLAEKKTTFYFDEDAEKLAQEEESQAQLWRVRSGVALSLAALAAPADGEATVLSSALGLEAFKFVLESGLRDRNGQVRDEMLRANIALVDAHGKHAVKQFLSLLDGHLDESKSGKSADIQQDWQREGAVVSLGALAKHLDAQDAQIPKVVDILVEALKTPSEPVQMAVTKCLPPLVKSPQLKEKETAAGLLNTVLDRAFDKNGGFAERRGAAMGLAGIVKGLGIGSLKAHQVVARLEAAGTSSDWKSRQGALMAFEMLCGTLGMLFEPYVITILPLLLQSFSDKENEVRESAHEAAKVVMGKLSGHGVKLVLPTLLESIQDPAWRTKQAAIQLLGSMAYCAPKQLASCLPQIVPRLVQAFTDTKAQVREAGKQALNDIGSVIKNPEILTLVPTLMGALVDPHKKTHHAVDTLHRTRFVHMVDAPSLALMVPVLHRGLKERSTDTKKKSALIVGNMCSMIADPKAVQPYVDSLIPILKQVLVDPIPGVRSTAAKAFGTLAKGLGENLPDFAQLLQWLIDTMRGDTSGVERSGGAQGLVEVLAALGDPRMDEVLKEHVFGLASHQKASVREGVVWVLVFLPPVLQRGGNARYIHAELTIVLRGLADEAEPVRDVSMRAGQVLVTQHALSHTNELLPALEGGLMSPVWRIRQSSLHLLGDLLFKVGGAHAAGVVVANTSQLAEDEGSDDEDQDSEDEDQAVDLSALSTVEVAIVNAIGLANRDRVLARLYMMRSDVSAVVRQSALKVWKSIVANTPRTLRQVMPVLMGLVVDGLSGTDESQQVVAGRTLGDVVRKLGERVLPDILPTLQRGLDVEGPTEEAPEGTNEAERVGVALGLRQVVVSAPKKQLAELVPLLMPSVLQAVCDPSTRVREHAAVAYNLIHKAAGDRVAGEVIPSLLQTVAEHGLASPEGQTALVGLREIVALRGRDVLPVLLPRLLQRPMSRANALALGAVAEVTGDMLHYHVEGIYAALLAEIGETPADVQGEEAERVAALREAGATVVSSVSSVGVQVGLASLLEYLADRHSSVVRAAAADMVAGFCQRTQADFAEQVPLLLKDLIRRLADADQLALEAAWRALGALTSRVPAAALAQHVGFCRDSIQNTASAAKHRRGEIKRDAEGNFVLAGFCLARGIGPLLPMYQHALMNGSAEERSSAAEGLEEIIALTEAAALKPFVVKITGPLIRIVGDRFSAQVKAAILGTLHTLLAKAGPFLRPFLPQLQTTFVKALGSESQLVRDRSHLALSRLIAFSTRVDPLVGELAAGAAPGEADEGVRASQLGALATVLERSGTKVSAPVRQQVREALTLLVQEEPLRSPKVRKAACLSLAHLVALDEPENGKVLVSALVADPFAGFDAETEEIKRLYLVTLAGCLFKVAFATVSVAMENVNVLAAVSKAAADPKLAVQEAAGPLACAAIEMHMRNGVSTSGQPVVNCAKVLERLMGDSKEDVRAAAVEALGELARATDLADTVLEMLQNNAQLASTVLACAAQDSSSIVRAAGEVAWYWILQVKADGADATHLKAFVASPPGGDKELGKGVSALARRTLSKMDL